MPTDVPQSPAAEGAYGLHLVGEPLPASRLSAVPPGAPRWELAVGPERAAPPTATPAPTGGEELSITLTSEQAEIVADGSRLHLDRGAQTATVATAAPLDPEFLVHPFAAGIGACAAHWSARSPCMAARS